MENCILLIHISILIALIVLVGGFAGFINSLRYSNKSLDSEKSPPKTNTSHYILSGIGAAILVPLFLNMLSSNLIKYTNDYDKINYFVFAGFCFIAGYFSDKFIDSIGDKLLKEIQQTKDKVDSTNDKLEKTSQNVLENQEKVDALIESESEVDEEELNSEKEIANLNVQTTIVDDDIKPQMKNIINAFKGKYRFRTIDGIAKELKYAPTMVEIILKGLEQHGAVKKFSNSKGNMVWSLTKIGQLMN